MTTGQSWTPAPRGGLIPLHPLPFGTILGRTFGALRSNPRVLLGFAMGLQLVASALSVVIIGALSVWLVQRINNADPTTDDFDAIMAGSIAVFVIAGIVIAMCMGIFSVIAQLIVLGEIAHATVGERATLGMIWRRVRGSVFRVIGYFVLSIVAWVAFFFVIIVLVTLVALLEPIAAGFMVFALILGVIPLLVWVNTKLALVPSAIVFERIGVFAAIGRSWRLTRRRFWKTFGVTVLISIIINVGGSIITVPFSFLAPLLFSFLAPTGSIGELSWLSFVITLALPQLASIVVAAVGLIIQSTAAGLLYLDSRMSWEGLDLKLRDFIDRRAAGASNLDDPYLRHTGAAMRTEPTVPAPAYTAPDPAYNPRPDDWQPQTFGEMARGPQTPGAPQDSQSTAQSGASAASPSEPPTGGSQWAPPASGGDAEGRR